MDSEREVLLILTVLTTLVFLENLWLIPWSPSMVIYSILAILIPLRVRNWKELGLNRPREFKSPLKYSLLAIIACYLIVIGFFSIYYVTLESLGLRGNTQFDYDIAVIAFLEHAKAKFGSQTGSIILFISINLWAPVGEEPLYRGYAFNTLMEKRSFIVSATVSSLYFAVRHVSHFLAVPSTPIFPGLVWCAYTLPIGYIMRYVLRRTGSLYPGVAVHFLINISLAFQLLN